MINLPLLFGLLFVRRLSSVECPTEFSKGLLYSQLVSLLILVRNLDFVFVLVLIHSVVSQLVLHGSVVGASNYYIGVCDNLGVLIKIKVCAEHASITKVLERITNTFADDDIVHNLF